MYSILELFETFSPLIPLVIYLIKKATKSKWIIILLIYIVAYIPLSAYANFLKSETRNNSLIYLIINIISFICLSLIIEDFIGKKKFKQLNKLMIIVVILFSAANLIWWDASTVFNSNSFAFTGLILICYCLYYYKLQLEKLQTLYVERLPSFWIVSGIFLYCSGNFFLFAFYHTLVTNYVPLANYAWYFNNIIILFMNILFAKGIQCNWQK